VTVSDTVAGPSLSVTQADLAAKLAGKAAVEISRRVNASLVSFQVDKGAAAAAQQRAASGQTLYLVRLEGVAQRDRDKIKIVRDLIASQVRGASAQVDPSQSNATRVTLNFSVAGPFDTENLIDALYAQHKHISSFEAAYGGNNEFIIRY
jgi:multidrug efflux pump subunit AcrA (membrane-fusion protein)